MNFDFKRLFEKRPTLYYTEAKYSPKFPAFRGFFYRNGIYLDGISLYRQIQHK